MYLASQTSIPLKSIDAVGRESPLEKALIIAGMIAEIVFVGLLTKKSFFRQMPFFYGYMCFGICNDLALFLIQHRFPSQFFHAYVAQTCIDSALQYGILVELWIRVLRPMREALSRRTALGLAGLILVAWMAIWPFCVPANLPRMWQVVLSVQESTSILRILVFLLLIAGSQFLALGWRDRELQVATGLGCYSLVSFAAIMVHTHQKAGVSYHWVDFFVALSFVASLVYWVISFAHAEAPRREFTPQMRSVLMAVAGNRDAQLAGLQRGRAIRG